MNIRIKFLGGAQSVTGSKFLIMVDEYNFLIDCGLFQGLKELRIRNWDRLPVDPKNIHSVLLTHAHIDHSGYIPLLCKSGFNGKIHCTEPTLALARLMLADSGKLQEEEADFANKKGYSKHHPARPLYTQEDAYQSIGQFKTHRFEETFSLNGNIEVRFIHSGHILGAASIEVIIHTAQGPKTLLFSGDLGPSDSPLHLAPKLPTHADVLLVESTYGDRLRQEPNLENQLRRIINEADERRGCLIIPAFSVGRTQLIIYYLWKLFQNMRSRPVYIDSPMAISATDIYKKYDGFHRLTSKNNMIHDIFDAPFIHYVTQREKSKLLNTLQSNSIIISAGGMVTGGRILHHLYHRLPKENDTILFTGFLPVGTRGRSIVDGEKHVKIFGEKVEIKAHVEKIDGLSAHADQKELTKWVKRIHKPPKRTFIIHGEPNQSNKLKEKLDPNWNVEVPNYMETFTLFDHI